MKKKTTPARLGIKKGDTVIVLSGRDREDSQGHRRSGQVMEVFPSARTLTVDGVNMVTRHQKARRDSPFGQMQQGVIQKAAPMSVSKVMLLCPQCHKGTRPFRILQPDGHRARYCRKCGKAID